MEESKAIEANRLNKACIGFPFVILETSPQSPRNEGAGEKWKDLLLAGFCVRFV